MESFLKRICDDKTDDESHRYFIRFGKGVYNRRFLLSYNKGKNIKIKASFELANYLVKFVKSIKSVNFSGKVFTKEKINGLDGKKKAGVFVYEVQNSKLSEFAKVYYYLVDVEDPEITLKIKKALPKPGKDAEKIDDGFCVLTMDEKYWSKIKEGLFWDVPEGKKAIVEHTLQIDQIEIPEEEKDPVKMRENALRKGKIIRIINLDGKDIVKEYKISA